MIKIDKNCIDTEHAKTLFLVLTYLLNPEQCLSFYDIHLIDTYLNKILTIYERNCDDYESCRFSSKRKNKQKRKKI